MQPGEILAKAMENLELNGWCKYQLTDKNGSHCARGAVLAAIAFDWRRHHWPDVRIDEELVIHALAKAIPEETLGLIGNLTSVANQVVTYNNEYCDSIDDVFDWFSRAKEFV